MIRIAVDAMGGDHAPREVVHGSILAAQEFGVEILLVGPPEQVEAQLKRHDIKGLKIKVIPATEVVAMDEKPTRAILKKKDSSIMVTAKQVADGAADGMVAAGSTGAALAAAQLTLGRIPNVERSAIAARMPTIHGTCLLIDAGANVECDAHQMVQFAVMGSVLHQGLYNVKQPRVAILNNGSEESKGTDLAREAFKLCKEKKELNFIGFCEGRDYPMGKVDVVVTDGFTGNVSLKTAEGIANMIRHMLRQELMKNVRVKIGSVIAEPAFLAMKSRVDPDVFGGALLVGVKGVCVIAHGGSKHTAVKNAIRVARDMVQADVVKKITSTLGVVATTTLGSGSLM